MDARNQETAVANHGTHCPAAVASTASGQPTRRGWRRALLQYLRRYFVRSEHRWIKQTRLWALSNLARLVVSALAVTYRVRVSGFDVMTRLRQEGRGFVMVGWHDKTLVPVHLMHGHGYYALISQSRVGELQARIFQLFGWNVIRGSTKSAGAQALRAATRALRQGHIVAFTPDGPTGPRHECQLGAIYLASLARCPIIAFGVAAAPCKQLPTWDRFMIPSPFSRVALIVSEPLHVPPRLTKEQVEEYAGQVGDLIESVERQAEMMVHLAQEE